MAPLSSAHSLSLQGDSCLSCDARVLAALQRGPAEGLEPAPGLLVSTGADPPSHAKGTPGAAQVLRV